MVYQFGQVIERSIEEFTVKFLLYVLGCFLVPTFKEIVHEEIACSFGNPATYIRDFLVEGIKNYRRKITMEYSGCIYLLLVLFSTLS